MPNITKAEKYLSQDIAFGVAASHAERLPPNAETVEKTKSVALAKTNPKTTN